MALARKIFIAADGRVRSGWALLGFLVALGLALTAVTGVQFGLGFAPFGKLPLGDPRLIPVSVGRLIAALIATWAGCAIVRQSPAAAGFEEPRVARRFGVGFGWGAAAVSIAVAVPWLAGQEHFSGPDRSAPALLAAGGIQLLVFGPASAAEEILLRGFVLQQLSRGLGGLAHFFLARAAFGRSAAVVLSAAVFGLLHLSNPGASPLAALNTALIGLWFGGVVIRSGSLWESIGLHLGWNFCQGFIWGEPVSGLPTGISLLRRGLPGTALWSGAHYGPEASAVTSVVVAALLLAMLSRNPKTC